MQAAQQKQRNQPAKQEISHPIKRPLVPSITPSQTIKSRTRNTVTSAQTPSQEALKFTRLDQRINKAMQQRFSWCAPPSINEAICHRMLGIIITSFKPTSNPSLNQRIIDLVTKKAIIQSIDRQSITQQINQY